jgi:hypothetical protein
MSTSTASSRTASSSATRAASASYLPGLSDDEVKEVLRRIVQRLRKLLQPRLEAAENDAGVRDALGSAQTETQCASCAWLKPHASRAARTAAANVSWSCDIAIVLRPGIRGGGTARMRQVRSAVRASAGAHTPPALDRSYSVNP